MRVSAQVNKLLELSNELESKVSKKEKYETIRQPIKNSVQGLKNSKGILHYCRNPRPYEKKHRFTNKGIEFLKLGDYGKWVKILYERYGTDYKYSGYLVSTLADNLGRKTYIWELNIHYNRDIYYVLNKGLELGIFQAVRIPGSVQKWRVSPSVVKYLKKYKTK